MKERREAKSMKKERKKEREREKNRRGQHEKIPPKRDKSKVTIRIMNVKEIDFQ